MCVCVGVCVCVTVYELISTTERQNADWQQTLELNGSQITAYVLITSAHLINALPENPTDVIVGLIAWRRCVSDDAGGPAAAAESGLSLSLSAHIQQPAARRVAPGSTARQTHAAIEHNKR